MLNKLTKRFKVLAATLAIATSLTAGGFMVTQPVAAAPVDVLNACNSQSNVCKGTNSNTLYNILKNIINVLLILIGIISVIMIVVGGIRYTTSAGDAGQTKSARDTVLYALVGLAIAVMSFALVNWVLGQLK